MRSAPWHAGSLEVRERAFIMADIEHGLKCAALAVSEPVRGRRHWVCHLLQNATHAHAEAARRIADAEAHGWDVRELRVRLGQLGAELARLDQEQRKAA